MDWPRCIIEDFSPRPMFLPLFPATVLTTALGITTKLNRSQSGLFVACFFHYPITTVCFPSMLYLLRAARAPSRLPLIFQNRVVWVQWGRH